MLSNFRTLVCVALLAASSIASAQSDGGFFFAEPLEAFAARSEGIVGGTTPDGGTLPRALREYVGQPVVLYKLNCPECAELDPTALVVVGALADTGVPVVLLAGGKGGTKKSAQALAARLPPHVRVAYGKQLVVGYGAMAAFYGADGQPRAEMWLGGNADAWALQAAGRKLLGEAGKAVPASPPSVPSVGEPFPSGFVDELLGSNDAGPASLAGYLGQPHVVFLACSACEGANELDGFLQVVAPFRVPVIALTSHVNTTRENTERLAQQVGPRPGLRWGWGKNLKARSLKWSASTAFVLDKHGIVRLAASATGHDLANNAWLFRAALERAQAEP